MHLGQAGDDGGPRKRSWAGRNDAVDARSRAQNGAICDPHETWRLVRIRWESSSEENSPMALSSPSSCTRTPGLVTARDEQDLVPVVTRTTAGGRRSESSKSGAGRGRGDLPDRAAYISPVACLHARRRQRPLFRDVFCNPVLEDHVRN